MPSNISIGCQAGGPEASEIAKLKIPLFHALEKHVSSTHCDAIDEYALVLRIDGSLDQFGEEGLAHLRFAKKKRYITIDIQIPSSVWQPMNNLQFKAYLANQVTLAIGACVQRLKQESIVVAEKELFSQLSSATTKYLSNAKHG